MGKKTKKLIRQNFRDECIRRDKNCKFCHSTTNLEVHHITDRTLFPNGGYVKENGITVCPSCHLECELFHQTDGREWHEGKHPDELYCMIGSSLEMAKKADEG